MNNLVMKTGVPYLKSSEQEAEEDNFALSEELVSIKIRLFDSVCQDE